MPVLHGRYFNPHEGALNLAGIDDARPVAAWSHHHADYCVTELSLTASRQRAIEWALADVRRRGLAGQVEVYEAQLAHVRAYRAQLLAQRDRLVGAARRDPRAPRVDAFATFEG
jgi:hypothetical protein